MALEIAGVVLDKLLGIDVSEQARFARHAVPGRDGDLAQALGRPCVQIRVRGIFYGATAADDLKQLRGHLLAREPVDFLCDATGQGYFAQVLLDRLEVGQAAGQVDEFSFECALSEFVAPPPLPASKPLKVLDAGLLEEAVSLMDDAQNAMAEVAGLMSLLAGAADFGDPTTRLRAMLGSFDAARGDGVTKLSEMLS